MIRLSTLAVAAIIALCSCSRSTDPGPAPLAIRSGTFFGMCRGYCLHEVTITPSAATFLEHSRDTAGYPVKSRTIPISNQEWLDLTASLQLDALKSLDTVIGCPDCTDGGGEWIEIQTATMRRKVTFEYGKDVPAISSLLEKVRAIRKRGED